MKVVRAQIWLPNDDEERNKRWESTKSCASSKSRERLRSVFLSARVAHLGGLGERPPVRFAVLLSCSWLC